jgi:hypothetical protein
MHTRIDSIEELGHSIVFDNEVTGRDSGMDLAFMAMFVDILAFRGGTQNAYRLHVWVSSFCTCGLGWVAVRAFYTHAWLGSFICFGFALDFCCFYLGDYIWVWTCPVLWTEWHGVGTKEHGERIAWFLYFAYTVRFSIESVGN